MRTERAAPALALALALGSTLGAPRLHAAPAAPAGSGQDTTATSHRGGSPFRTSDVAYGAVAFGSVFLIEPLEGFERSVRAHTPSSPSGFDAAFVDGGGVAGNAFADLGVAVAAWGGGKLLGSPRFERAGLDAVESLVVADALLLGGKVLFGRARPSVTSDPDEFHPLDFHEAHQSFPSGHATRAFVLAAVAVGDFPEQRWLPWVAWPVAAATAASRVVGRDHWVTDVVSGAALGILSSRVVIRFNASRRAGGSSPERRAASLSLVPVAGGVGAVLDVPLH